MTYRENLMAAEIQLTEAGIMDAKTDAWLLLEKACRIDRNAYYLHQMDEMIKAEEESFFALVQKRKTHIPLQYITGEQSFMGIDFQVNESVLIPRQDTEVLVEEVLKAAEPDMAILDMCTGSGCIAVSIAKYKQKVNMTAADVSQDALATAKKNAVNCGVKIDFRESNMFSDIKGQFDIIVSNPPYIPTKVIESLMPEVREFEPLNALDGKEDGLHFYKILAQDGKEHLKMGGYLMLEIGCEQGEDVKTLLEQQDFTEIRIIKDLAGLDRVVTARKMR